MRAIAIGEKVLGPDHLDLAVLLNNLAELLREQVRTAGVFLGVSGDTL